jgi:adenylate kinase family enzyme
MKRVMIMGGPGSGKSTLARWLGDLTALPVCHMDHIHHLPDWAPRPLSEKIEMANAIEATDAWIFEGGLSSTYDNRAMRADSLVWLDLPIGLRLWRVTKRLVQNYGSTRPDMAEGCVETFGSHTIEFYQWIWQTRQAQRAKIVDLTKRFPHLEVFQLTSRKAVDDFQSQMRETAENQRKDLRP